MVTFALPGDNDAPDAATATPKARPGLAFSQRGFGASPYGSVGRRNGSSTPLGGSARKSLIPPRSEPPASSLSRSFLGQRNIFRSSAITDSPPTANTFSPAVPQSTLKRTFMPGATPESSRVSRELGAQSATRGVAAKAKDKDLFPMRIASPPPELSGEALAQKVPKDWDPKGSIYADQFLAHLAPADLDEDQRRQFFCILDLRRLKYAADEIFQKKGWKLNVMNFAKEFEKSRSIILLRYGLFEFQNVKPSKEILKRWRREHGLPDPDDEEVEPTPTKTVSKKKRKAVDDGEGLSTPALKSKRRNPDGDVPAAAPAPTGTPSFPPAPPAASAPKNKRKASVGEDSQEPPSKLQRPTSGARSMFEQAANKASTTPSATPVKPSSSTVAKPGNALFRSVLKSEAAQAASSSNGNIFGYLSDNSSAKNSGVDADAESESESEESPEAEQVEERSAKRPAVASAIETPSDAGTRESTPGRSLFERVTKDDVGQPVRATTPVESAAAAPKDQTWKATEAPIKFAPPTSTPQTGLFSGASSSAAAAPSLFAPKPSSAATGASALFGSKPSTPGSEAAPSVFAPKPSSASTIFGAPALAASKETSKEGSTEPAKNDNAESDKENAPGSEQAAAEPKPSAPQSSAGSIFVPKPVAAEGAKEQQKSGSSTSMFGASSTNTASNIFGSVASKPAAANPLAASSSVLGSTTLFGAKPAEAQKEPEKPASTGFPTPSGSDSKPASSIFGNGAASTSNLFGGSSSAAPAASTPSFAFGAGASSQASSKPLFAPKSPPSSSGNAMVDGSPMKQDDKSPAKPALSGLPPSSGPIFNFGGASSGAPSTATPAPTGNIFGAASNPTAGGNIFGAASSGQGSSGINFDFTNSSTSINNPFAAGGSGTPAAASTTFNFGGSSAPSTGSTPFQFGANSNTSSAPLPGLFAANQGNANGSTPMFGGSTTPGGSFNFSANTGPSQQAAGTPFGNNQNLFNLQPPTGGPSTGTNTPFSLGGGSSLATTPARGTPEPAAKAEADKAAEDEDGEKHEQINLTDGAEEGEDTLHEVRAKVLKFVPAGSEGDDKPKSKSPWSTQGVGPLRVLQNKETKLVRLLLRAEPRGHVALNRSLMPEMNYKADSKYVKITTSNEKGDGLETWMIQVKTKELATELAEALEKHKTENKK